MKSTFLTGAVDSAVDETVLIEALTVEGGPLAGEEPSVLSGSPAPLQALAALISQRHPVVAATAGIREQLRVSEEFVAAAAPLIAHLPPIEESREQLAAWLTTDSETVPETLIDCMVALQRLALLFKDSLPTDNTSVAFIATHQDLFAFVPGADWEWSHLLSRLLCCAPKAAGEHADAS